MDRLSREDCEEHARRDAVGVELSETSHGLGHDSVQVHVLYVAVGPVYNNNYLTAIRLSPCGSGFKHIYKYLTLLLKFTFTSGLHEKHVVTSCIFWNHLSSCFQETGKPRKKTCIEVVGHRTLRTLTSSHSNMYISTKHITR